MIARLLRRAWSRLPESLRRSAHLGGRRLLEALTPALMRLIWKRGRPAGPPVIVGGFFSAGTGLGQGARLFAQALTEGGALVFPLDVTSALDAPVEIGFVPPAGAPPPGGVLVTHFNPPELRRYLPKTLGRDVRGRRHIGYWAWELSEIPPTWRSAFAYVDEVWCPSRFTAEAVRKAAPPTVPVRVIPHPIFMTPRPAPDRARFGLPAEACVVLMALDLKSTAARKNPQGGLEAFRRAAPAPRPDVRLVCKLTGARQEPALFEALRREAAAREDIVLIAEALSPEDMTLLIASADILLSLHRAEGFGLLPAEAMWLGKCVVATGWSGNMDFMDGASSAPVRWRPAPVEDPQSLYAGGWWAEPDLDAAAASLRVLIADPAARAALGARARARAEQVFDREAWLAEVLPRLGQATPRGARPI